MAVLLSGFPMSYFCSLDVSSYVGVFFQGTSEIS